MATELKDDATHEDIQEFVDNIMKEQAGDEEDKKSDSQQIAEERDEPVTDTSAETDSGGDDTAREGEDTGTSNDQVEWIDDSVKAEAAAYGLDEKLLSEFSSREELDRALRVFDLHALEAGRKAMAAGEEESGEQPRDEHGRFAKTEPKEEQPTEGQYEVGLDKDVYDEELIKEFTRLRDHYESRLSAMETRFEEIDARAEEQLFDSIVDALGHADLFGKTGKESPQELQRRQDLHVAVKAQQIGLQTLGRETALDQSLVNRVARMVFAEELGKKDLKARTKKVAKQASTRMGGGATKAHDSVEPIREEMRRLYKELENA